MNEETATATPDPAPAAVAASAPGDTESASTASGEPDKAAGQTTETAEAATDDTGDQDGDELLSADEYAKVKDDPKKLKKALNRAYTQKTQALAEQRRFYEYAAQNPGQFMDWFARQYGFALQELPRQEDAITQALSAAVGPDQARQLAPTLQNITRAIVAQEVEPIRRTQEQQMAESAQSQAESALKAFEAKHPDYQELEPKMMAIATKIVPSSQVTELEWLETLYTLANSERASSKAAKGVVDRMNKAAAAAAENASPVPGSRVALSPGKNLTIREAYELAKRGQRVED